MEYNYIDIGDRLIQLRKARGYSQDKLIDILDDEYGVKIGRNTYSNIENGCQSASNFKLDLLIALSSLYGCDIGYLLCEYDNITGRNTDIQKITGLNDESIKALEGAVRESEIEKELYNLRNNKSLTVSETLNIMFKHGILVDIAKSFRNYLLTEYAVPIQYEPEQGKFTYSDSDFSRLNHKEINDMCDAFGVASFPDHYVMHLARTPEHPEDNISYALSEDFLESVALRQIQKYLATIKQLYKEENDNQTLK